LHLKRLNVRSTKAKVTLYKHSNNEQNPGHVDNNVASIFSPTVYMIVYHRNIGYIRAEEWKHETDCTLSQDITIHLTLFRSIGYHFGSPLPFSLYWLHVFCSVSEQPDWKRVIVHNFNSCLKSRSHYVLCFELLLVKKLK